MSTDKLLFQQLFEATTSTYTYILADAETREAVIIDPVLETLARDLELLSEMNLKLRWVLDTHVHADHITSAAALRERTGAQTAISAQSGVSGANRLLQHGETVSFGRFALKALATPGHTNSCMSYLIDDMVFTGDALLIRGSGRTDFQEGSAAMLYDSVHSQLFALPDATRVYPAHDYKGFTSSTIGMEKEHNKRLGGGRSKSDFQQIMAELKLAYPKRIDEALPANLAGGLIPSAGPGAA